MSANASNDGSNGNEQNAATDLSVVHIEVPDLLSDYGDRMDNRAKDENGEPLSNEAFVDQLLDLIPVDLSAYDAVVTGNQGWFTNTLQDFQGDSRLPSADPNGKALSGVETFFAKFSKFEDDDDVDSRWEAIQAARQWARKQMYVGVFDKYFEGEVDLAIKCDLGGNRMKNMRAQAKSEGVAVMEVKVTPLADMDTIIEKQENYNSESSSSSESKAAGSAANGSSSEASSEETEQASPEGEALPTPAGD